MRLVYARQTAVDFTVDAVRSLLFRVSCHGSTSYFPLILSVDTLAPEIPRHDLWGFVSDGADLSRWSPSAESTDGGVFLARMRNLPTTRP